MLMGGHYRVNYDRHFAIIRSRMDLYRFAQRAPAIFDKLLGMRSLGSHFSLTSSANIRRLLMKDVLAIVCLLGAVSACAGGSAGNPDGDVYAGMRGGAIAVQPQTMGIVAYDPRAPLKASTESSIVGISGDREDPANYSTPAQSRSSDVGPASR
jgi:hypothetical protein